MLGKLSMFSLDIFSIVPLHCITEYNLHSRLLFVLVGLVTMNLIFGLVWSCLQQRSNANATARGRANRTAFLWGA